MATHLQFVVVKKDDKIVLRSHLAMANPQAEDILTRKSLVIFTEPHASISPKNYEKEQKIPISRTAIGKGTNDIAFPNKRLNQ